MNDDPKSTYLLGIDGAYNIDNFELKIELDGGERNHKGYYAVLHRLRIKLDDEERWQWDIQPTYVNEQKRDDWLISNALNYQLTSDIKLSLMYRYEHQNSDNMVIGQIYFYKPV